MENISETKNVTLNSEKNIKKEKVAKIIRNILIYSFLVFVAILSFLPFYWMIITSLKTEPEYRQSVPTFFPHFIQWKNYSYIMSVENNLFGTTLLNTIVVGVVSTLLGVLMTIITAYAFARIDFKGKNILFAILLATMMIPGELYTTTNYITVGARYFGWNNTYVVMIVPFLVSVYYIYLLRNNFMQIPDSLYKAAKVDGISDIGYLFKVMVPLTMPTLISITLLKFIGTWNSYIWPQLVNEESWRMISNWMQMTTFSDKNAVLSPTAYNETMTTLRMAASCMVSLPLFVLFIFFRKYIMKGVSKSGTKG